jgi:hypothetical protein
MPKEAPLADQLHPGAMPRKCARRRRTRSIPRVREGPGLTLYPEQEEAILEVFAGKNVILNTPTGSGKSLVATAMHFWPWPRGGARFTPARSKHSSAKSSSRYAAILAHNGGLVGGICRGVTDYVYFRARTNSSTPPITTGSSPIDGRRSLGFSCRSQYALNQV